MPDQYEFRLHVQGPGQAWEYAIPLGITLIGRIARSALRLPYAEVSREHARLIYTGAECQIEDLGSANGTLVNGQRLNPNQPVSLTTGSTIRIGPCLLTLGKTIGEMPGRGEDQRLPVASPEGMAQEGFSGEAWASSDWAAEEIWEDGLQGARRQPPPPPDGRGRRRTVDPHEPMPPGLRECSVRLFRYLPDIYHTQFMMGYLALFERILIPIEWNIENFDLNLNPRTALPDFLPWLARWFDLVFNPTWSEEQRRLLLENAHMLYARRGTPWALSLVLEIYTGIKPEIIDNDKSLAPFTFRVYLPVPEQKLNRELIERLINTNKPAHTSYTLEFKE